MNTNELSAVVAKNTGESQAAVRAVLNAAFEEIGARLAAGDEVALTGFGVFQVRERAARTGRNPQTGESMEIAASRTPAFKPYSGLKAKLKS